MARILIVDDEPDVRELFNITLKMAGHVTDTAKHGLEAVDKLASDIPELIVLDLMMPHLDGFGLLNHIRNEMPTKPVRVLVATAKVLEDSDQEKLGSWPVVGVLNKGELDIGQMVMIVSTALSQNPLKAGVAAPAVTAAAPSTASAPPTPASSPATPATTAPATAPSSPAASPSPAPITSTPATAPSSPVAPSLTPAAPTSQPSAPAASPTPSPSSSTPPSPTPTPASSTPPPTTSPTTKDGA